MKKIALWIAIIYSGLLFVVAFAPMQNLYFLAERTLQKTNLFVNEKHIDQTFVFTTVSGGEVYFEDIQALKFHSLGLSLWLLYNSLHIENITIGEALRDFIPLNIEFISVSYSVLNPLNVKIEGQGDFGVLSGNVNLLDQKARVNIQASIQMKDSFQKTLSFMKRSKKKDKDEKLKKDWYYYEYSF